MKIVIPTIGTRGDVQPFIALAQGLGAAGHNVTLMSHPVMHHLVVSYGVLFSPIGPDIDLGVETASIRDRSQIALVGVIRAMQFSFDMLKASHHDILAGCRGADLVIYSAQSAAGRNEADMLGIPSVSVSLTPWGIPYADPERPFIKRLGYGAMDWGIGLITTRPLNRLRKSYGLPPVGSEGFVSSLLNLVPVSPLVFEPNPNWSSQHQSVGYWFVEEPGSWRPPADLMSFLSDGELPIVIGLGAMSLSGSHKAREAASIFIEAIQNAGIRAVVQGWDEVFDGVDIPSDIYTSGSIPHSWLLPRTRAVVHHGGFGTTAAGFRAGIPQLVVPHLVDQFYWGQRVHELGVGPPPISRPKLSVENLANALGELIQDPSVRVASSQLGEGIRSETGVENAVHLVNEILSPEHGN